MDGSGDFLATLNLITTHDVMSIAGVIACVRQPSRTVSGIQSPMFTDGFLGYRTSFMLDFVVCALVLIVPLLLYSLWLVKVKKAFAEHKRMQLVLGAILLFAVGAFEIDLQVVHGGWENIVQKSYSDDAALAAKVAEARPYLRVHLLFAVTTPILWCITIVLALRRFPSPPVPGAHSGLHKKLGWLSTIDISLTAVTGLAFYYIAFMS